MDIWEDTRDLDFENFDDFRNWKCPRCNILFTNYNNFIFHRKVSCPNMTRREKNFVVPNEKYEATKKSRECFRCGRLGHYYRRKECYATRDNKGELITWGEPQKPKKIKNPPKKTWETPPGAYLSYFSGIQIHYPKLKKKKEINIVQNIC